MRPLFCFLIAALSMFAAPQITTPGARHAAGYSKAVPKGARFVLVGKQLGPQETASSESFPLQLSTGGVSVKITVGDVTADAPVLQAGSGMVVALLPSSVPEGTGKVALTFNDETAETTIRVVSREIGLYSTGAAGAQMLGQAQAKAGDDAPVLLQAPAKPGQTVRLRASGFGASAAGVDELAGPAAQDFEAGFTVRVGAVQAKVVAAKRTDVAGVDEITIEIPQSAPTGCYVPVAVSGESNFVTLPVSASSVCTSPRFGNTALDALAAAGEAKIGESTLSRMAIKADMGEFVMDSFSGSFAKYKFDALANTSSWFDIPMGACAVLRYDEMDETMEPMPTTDATPLAAGRITLTGPKGTKSVANVKGSFSLELGQGINIPLPPGVPSIPGLPGGALFLDPGAYTLTGEGGEDVGAFRVEMTLNPVQWSNTAAFATVNRSADATFTWTGGGANDMVIATGSATDLEAKVVTAFYCIGKASERRLVVPSYILSALPASGSEPDAISLMSVAEGKSFSARGIDVGTFQAFRINALETRYR